MPVDQAGREPGEAGYDQAGAEVRDLEHGKGGDKGKGGKPGGGAPSFVKAHRDQILIVLTLAGVLIAYLTMRKPAGGGPSAAPAGGGAYDPTAAAGTPNVGGPGDAGGALDGFSAYLAHMQQSIDQLQSTLGAGGSSSTSTPPGFDYGSMSHSWANEPLTAPPRFLFGRAAQGLRYIREKGGTGRIFQVNPNGKLQPLSAAQYAELGKPKYVSYGRAPRPAKKKPTHPAPTKRR